MTQARWQCPNCGEEHEAEFPLCWKCGSNPAGKHDPAFEISEPVGEQDQSPDEPTEDSPLPSLQLPTLTYFSIPPYVCLMLWLMFRKFTPNRRDFSLSMEEILVGCLAAVFVGIPLFFTMLKAFGLTLGRPSTLSNTLAELLWMFSMFRLPESFQRSYRWFMPIYYGSLAAMLIAPLGIAVWILIESWR